MLMILFKPLFLFFCYSVEEIRFHRQNRKISNTVLIENGTLLAKNLKGTTKNETQKLTIFFIMWVSLKVILYSYCVPAIYQFSQENTANVHWLLVVHGICWQCNPPAHPAECSHEKQTNIPSPPRVHCSKHENNFLNPKTRKFMIPITAFFSYPVF